MIGTSELIAPPVPGVASWQHLHVGD